MTDVLVTNGTVLTQDADRDVIDAGAVAVADDRISAVGSADRLEAETDPDRIIDADGGAVIPGLINAHTHVSDILLRGAFDADRGLYDWLFNVKQPALSVMDADEHALAARLYCVEAIRSGTTTFVENATALDWTDLEPTRRKLAVYDRLGVRNVYGAGLRDRSPDEEFERLYGVITDDGGGSVHPGPDALVVGTEDGLADAGSLIETYHEPAGRQSVWPAPATLATTTPELLRGAYRLAEEYDVMTTAHVAEAEAETRERGAISSIEYLRNVGYLGERALLGHCVQTNDRDVRLLAKTNTPVVHNFRANMRLATGFAPVVDMLGRGVTVCLGTDNTILNDTVNPLSDARAVATAHKGYHRDSGVVPAGTAFDLVTRDAAEAIGRADDLGSLEPGKQADLAVIDLDRPHLTPAPDPVHALVYGLQGGEVETVLCAGEVVMEDWELPALTDPLPELLSTAERTAADVVRRADIE
ncbi:amidohydrolase family protein [Haloplanus salinarum]|uniref:amidohydrolase family protein n=1 Tax=Haloplanus salinarum TaxID=1912324 RepID=UPI00214B8651|nr:amidohydrolase [Haloplanus salinarum]